MDYFTIYMDYIIFVVSLFFLIFIIVSVNRGGFSLKNASKIKEISVKT